MCKNEVCNLEAYARQKELLHSLLDPDTGEYIYKQLMQKEVDALIQFIEDSVFSDLDRMD